MRELIEAISAYQRHYVLNDTEMGAILGVSPALLSMARNGKRSVWGKILRGAARIPALFPYCVHEILPDIDEQMAKEEQLEGLRR